MTSEDPQWRAECSINWENRSYDAVIRSRVPLTKKQKEHIVIDIQEDMEEWAREVLEVKFIEGDDYAFYTEDDWRLAVDALEGIRKLEERHGLSNVSAVGHLVTLPSGHIANALHELKRLRGFKYD
jgi:hypothetical protein